MKHAFATTTLAAVLGVCGAATADADVGDGIVSANIGQARIAPVDNVQFFFGGQNYCWYDSGWQGPGWYWCGYAWRSGYGWGGGMGFHGWTHPGGGPNVGTVNKGPTHVGAPAKPQVMQHFNNAPKGNARGPKGPSGNAPKGAPMGGPKKRIP
jgi:hypothetical protein